MTTVSTDLILAHAREALGVSLTRARAEALATTVNTLLGACDRRAADLAFEAEPAAFAAALDELAEK